MRYHYVGPADLLALVALPVEHQALGSVDDWFGWLARTGQGDRHGRPEEHTVTYTVDTQGQLWVTDRHCEHVACARGKPVTAAGELTIWSHLTSRRWEVVYCSNQSTGYCPQPACWEALVSACERASLPLPQAWSAAFVFRRCEKCQTINVVKEAQFVCAVCETPLSLTWNLADQ